MAEREIFRLTAREDGIMHILANGEEGVIKPTALVELLTAVYGARHVPAVAYFQPPSPAYQIVGVQIIRGESVRVHVVTPAQRRVIMVHSIAHDTDAVALTPEQLARVHKAIPQWGWLDLMIRHNRPDQPITREQAANAHKPIRVCVAVPEMIWGITAQTLKGDVWSHSTTCVGVWPGQRGPGDTVEGIARYGAEWFTLGHTADTTGAVCFGDTLNRQTSASIEEVIEKFWGSTFVPGHLQNRRMFSWAAGAVMRFTDDGEAMIIPRTAQLVTV